MFRSINNDKIGNVLNYLASNIEFLSMTKTLKLLYLIDETSIRETGVPVTWLDYKVWGDGPVAIDIYNEIKRDEIICHKGKELTVSPFVSYEKKVARRGTEIYIHPKGKFNDRIFNGYELDLFERVLSKFGRWTATRLIQYLHDENSLWAKIVKQHNLTEHFQNYNKITNYSIEFSELIENDPMLQMANQASLEALQFKDNLSEHAD